MKCIKYIGPKNPDFRDPHIIRVPDNHARQWVKKGDWKYVPKNDYKRANKSEVVPNSNS